MDRKGVRIAISGKSAYDLYLTRSLQHADRVPHRQRQREVRLPRMRETLRMTRDEWRNYICCVLTVRQELIDQNPGLVQDLVNYVQGAGMVKLPF